MKPPLKVALSFYRLFLSPLISVGFGVNCRFNETCSRYTERMIDESGPIKGIRLGMKRFLSCNAWTASENFVEKQNGK